MESRDIGGGGENINRPLQVRFPLADILGRPLSLSFGIRRRDGRLADSIAMVVGRVGSKAFTAPTVDQ